MGKSIRTVVIATAAMIATAALFAAVPARAALINLHAELSGDQVVPSTGSPGTGSASLTYDDDTNVLSFNIAYSGLLGQTETAFFHVAPAGTNGPIVIVLSAGSPIIGTVDLDTDLILRPTVGCATVDACEARLLAGDFYINIHTLDLFPGGEIRGQVLVVPEPATLALLGLALAGLGFGRRKRIGRSNAPLSRRSLAFGSARAGAVLLGMCAMLGWGPAHANLITNGDFTTGAPTRCVTTPAPGWTVTHNFIFPTVFHCGASPGFGGFYNGAGTAENGPGVIVFNAADRPAVGTLSQTFDTVPGATYVLEFDYGVTAVLPDNTQSLGVSVLGNNRLAVLVTDMISDSNNGTTADDDSLSSFSYAFTADGTEATLVFSDLPGNATNSIDGVLDNVSVVAASEPATLVLLGIALAGLSFNRRRRIRRPRTASAA